MITLGLLNDIPGIRHGFFTREHGVSRGIYASRNCGLGSDDDRENVLRNRALCLEELGAPACPLVTVHQIHSADAVTVGTPWPAENNPRADAMVTDEPGLVLGILTADCAPVLMVDPGVGVIGAAHAGWKGALGGILEATVDAMRDLGAVPEQMTVGIGPRIAQRSYEVGPEFRERFLAESADYTSLFAPGRAPDRFLFDLTAFLAGRLRALGIRRIQLAPNDTAGEEDRFFSYRRACQRGESDYGRCLSAIMLDR